MVAAVRIDLRRLHAAWRELLFPRRLDPGRVIGRWEPDPGVQRVAYRGWAAVGVPLLLVAYPLLLVGVAVRSHAGEVATAAAARLGVADAAVAALGASRAGGRATGVLLAYPAGVTALLLPPVVAALYAPALTGWVFPNSQALAVRLLDNVLAVGGLDAPVRERFDLRGLAYVATWAGIAVPVGWLLGGLVALGDVVRPGGGTAAGRARR